MENIIFFINQKLWTWSWETYTLCLTAPSSQELWGKSLNTSQSKLPCLWNEGWTISKVSWNSALLTLTSLWPRYLPSLMYHCLAMQVSSMVSQMVRFPPFWWLNCIPFVCTGWPLKTMDLICVYPLTCGCFTTVNTTVLHPVGWIQGFGGNMAMAGQL